MKLFLFYILLLVGLLLSIWRNEQLINKTSDLARVSSEPVIYQPNWKDSAAQQVYIETCIKEPERLLIFGSSELSYTKLNTIPYHFFYNVYGVPTLAIGHQGNQCFNIFCELAVLKGKLKNRKILIILSPGWFEDKFAKGTNPEVFLEYFANPANLNFYNSLDREEKDIIGEYIYNNYSYLSNANYSIRQIYFDYIGHRSSINFPYSLYASAIKAFNTTKAIKIQLLNSYKKRLYIPLFNYKKSIDSLITNERKNKTNNPYGISNSYYNEYIKNKKLKKIRPNLQSRELNDFKNLIRFLKKEQANAFFVLQPLNPHGYRNLYDLDSTINQVIELIQTSGFKYLNLYNSNKANFNYDLLEDIMHFSGSGWLLTDSVVYNNLYPTNTIAIKNENKR